MDTKAQKEHIQKGYVNSPKHCHLNKHKQRRSHEKGHHTGERWGAGDCGNIGTEARRSRVLNIFKEGKMMKHIQWTQQNIPGDSSKSQFKEVIKLQGLAFAKRAQHLLIGPEGDWKD